MDRSKLIILGSSIAILGIVGYWLWRKRRESFKVLGHLGPYKELYYKCTSDCERSDPGKQLSPSKGSQACQSYCDSTITDVSRRGGPTYPLDYRVKPTSIPAISGGGDPITTRPTFGGGPRVSTVPTSVSDAYYVCGDGEVNAWCRSLYHTATEIDKKCRQDCEYSTYPTEECMKLCSASKVGNYSLGWSWK